MEHNISEQIKFRRFKEIPAIIPPSKELIMIASLIDKMPEPNIEAHPEKLKQVLKTSREFLSKYLTLNPIPYVKEYKLFNITKIEINGYIHPFNLPVKKVKNNDMFYGCSNEIIYFNTTDFLKYRWIELSSNLTEVSSLSYTHELTHTQLNHCEGIVNDYNNVEFLSIFLELVQALETKEDESLLILHDNLRLRELQSSIIELDKYATTYDDEIKEVLIEGTSYLHSTLKAYQLFFIYYYGNNETKYKIMHYIQEVFNHRLTVEGLLKKFNITFTNSQNKDDMNMYLKRRF